MTKTEQRMKSNGNVMAPREFAKANANLNRHLLYIWRLDIIYHNDS